MLRTLSCTNNFIFWTPPSWWHRFLFNNRNLLGVRNLNSDWSFWLKTSLRRRNWRLRMIWLIREIKPLFTITNQFSINSLRSFYFPLKKFILTHQVWNLVEQRLPYFFKLLFHLNYLITTIFLCIIRLVNYILHLFG